MIPKQFARWVVFALLLAILAPVYAEDSPYTIAVEVYTQNPAERTQAFHKALAEVVNVISNNPNTAFQLGVNKVPDVLPYIKRFYYEKADEEDEDEGSDGLEEVSGIPTATNKLQYLVVEFDPLAIDNYIKAPVVVAAPSNLTHVLLWLEVDDENKKPFILANDEQDKLAQQVKYMGKSKNLDIMLPMMDIDDLAAISISDVTQFKATQINQASIRYGNDLVLVAVMKETGLKWNAKWMLIKNGERFTWNDTGFTLNGAILSGLLKASDMITTPSSIELNKEDRLVLTISNLESVTDYAKINAYLQKLDEISSLQVIRVEATRVIFDVRLVDSDRKAFTKALQNNSHLTLEPSSSSQELNFRWSTH